MIEIRSIGEHEIPKAKELVPAGAPEPEWKNMYGVFADGELSDIFGLETRLFVEPYYSSGKHNMHTYGAFTWIDGFIRGTVAQHGKRVYEFFVANSNPTFQNFIRKHLPVEEHVEKPGSVFMRKF